MFINYVCIIYNMAKEKFKGIPVHLSTAKKFKILVATVESNFENVKGYSGTLELLMKSFEARGNLYEEVSHNP